MTKIACCISGCPSTRVLEHIHNLSKYRNMFDYFVYMLNTIPENAQKQLKLLLDAKDIKFEPMQRFMFDARFKEPDKKNTKERAFSMFYGISRVQKMRMDYEKKNNIQYDIIIRLRYDDYFLEGIDTVIKRVQEYINDDTVIFPIHSHHIGMCDQLWFGTSKQMNKFANLFDWIRCNLDRLYFVNENVLCRFLIANNINFHCINIPFVLRRECDDDMTSTEHQLYGKYLENLRNPWVQSCPEARIGKCHEMVVKKNDSANTIYFFTKQLYCEMPCKLMNQHHHKFAVVTPTNIRTCITSGIVPTQFKIRVYNCHLVNLVVNLDHKPLYLTANDDRVICGEDMHNPNAQFYMTSDLTPTGMLDGEPKVFQFIVNKTGDNSSGSLGFYLYMDGKSYLRADGATDTVGSKWMLM